MANKNRKQLQWYPGHMAKATRQISEKLGLIDVVIEVLDARAPAASQNPSIEKQLAGRKLGHIILLNKADLADPVQTQKWQTFLAQSTHADAVLPFVAFDKKMRQRLIAAIQSANLKNKAQVRCLICGIPNVGKSAIINTLSGRRKAEMGNKPGVTKGQQWIQTESNILFLDTPGILWPKFDDELTGITLAWLGSIKDTIYEKENLAGDLMAFLAKKYPDALEKRYGLTVDAHKPAWQLFDDLCARKKLLMRGGTYDYARASAMILTDFRNGKLGRITVDVR